MIFLTTLSTLAIMASQSADSMAKSRDDYALCLRQFLIAQLEKRTPPDKFNKDLQPACAKQEATFREAVIAADKADNMTSAEAQEDAQFQVEDYLDKFQSSYRDFLETNTQPG